MTDPDKTQLIGAGAREEQQPEKTRIATPASPPAADDRTMLASAPAEQPATLGKYRITRILGEGAMGVVYEAIDPLIERRVALKTVRKDLLDKVAADEILARFKREAQAAGRLNHPGIVSVYEYAEDGDTAFIAMEFVEGEELDEIFQRGERPKIEYIQGIILQLLDALQYAHEQGIVHRDIKPANIILMANGKIKVADFGIAHVDSSSLTQSGAVLGTPAYMSPEQCLGQAVDARSDLFSVGALLYYLVTGEKPFAGDNFYTIMQRVLNTEPDPPTLLNNTLPKAIDGVIARALAKKAGARYQSAAEFAEAVRQISLTGNAPSAGGDQKSGGSKGRMAVAAAIVGALVIGAAGYLFMRTPATDVSPAAIVAPAPVASAEPQPVAEPEPVAVAPVQTPEPVVAQPAPTSAQDTAPQVIIIQPDAPRPAPVAKQPPVATAEPQPEAGEPASDPSLEFNSNPVATLAPRPLAMQLTTDRGVAPEYRVGEKLVARLTAADDAFLYCFYQDYSGVVMRVLPNRFRQDNRIVAGQTLNIPDAADGFEILMEKPGSSEALLCAASASGFSDAGVLSKGDLEPLGVSLVELQAQLTAAGDGRVGFARLPIRIR